MAQNQITIPIPSLPADWHSTAFGLLASACYLLKIYTVAGSITLEQAAIALFVTIICYFIPAKPGKADQAKMMQTVQGIVDSTLGAKLPEILTKPVAIPGIAETALEAVEQIAEDAATPLPAPSPAAPVLGS
jgi:hypothetical protein